MKQLFRRLGYLLNRRRFDQELANDLEFHREMAALHGGGNLGNEIRLREEARDAWGWTWIERLLQDFRYAARMLRKTPGFALAAVLMLAIGIGANIAAFGFFNLMVLKPLPVRAPDKLLRFKRRAPQSYASKMPYPEMDFFRQYSRTLSAVLAVSDGKLSVDEEAKPLSANFVTANLFSELGAVALHGRVFDPARDAMPGADPVVVLSEDFWVRHFASDASIVGKTIRLNHKPATVIGVVGSSFSGLSMDQPDVWAPITQQPYFVTGSQLLTDFSVEGTGVTMFGRLQPGLTAAAAENELQSLAAELHKQHPKEIWANEAIPSLPGGYVKNLGGGRFGTGKEKSDEAYPIVGLVGALVLLILMVACGNLGSLLLARSIAREREISIRMAVGAGPGRLVRQLFTESLLLALLGAMAGVALGYAVLQSLIRLTDAPRWLDPTPDWRMVVFALGAAFVSAVLFGLTPALQSVRPRQRKTSARMQQFLLGAQVAGSCVLLIVAALLVRALGRAVTAHPGFEYEHVVAIDPGLSSHGFSPANARAYLNALEGRLRDVPGITAVSMTSSPPLGRRQVTTGVEGNGRAIEVHMYAVAPGFMETMAIPMLQGKALARGENTMVISKSLAQRWPEDKNPLGQKFQVGTIEYTITGICGDAHLVAIEDSESTEAYYLAPETEQSGMVVLVKASGPPEGLVSFVASIARSIDPTVFPQIQMLKSSFRQKVRGVEYSAWTAGLLGSVALLLACLGIVGLVAYSISQRMKEIGIRIALGANPAQVLSAVLRRISMPVILGLLIGLGCAAGLSQVLRRQLFGISHLDPAAYLTAAGLFVATAAIAAIIPARRALRIDPTQALRND